MVGSLASRGICQRAVWPRIGGKVGLCVGLGLEWVVSAVAADVPWESGGHVASTLLLAALPSIQPALLRRGLRLRRVWQLVEALRRCLLGTARVAMRILQLALSRLIHQGWFLWAPGRGCINLLIDSRGYTQDERRRLMITVVGWWDVLQRAGTATTRGTSREALGRWLGCAPCPPVQGVVCAPGNRLLKARWSWFVSLFIGITWLRCSRRFSSPGLCPVRPPWRICKWLSPLNVLPAPSPIRGWLYVLPELKSLSCCIRPREFPQVCAKS